MTRMGVSRGVNKIWSDFKIRATPILMVLKSESKKETEDGLLFEGLKKILVTISGQKAENMTIIVNFLKEGLVVKKDDSPASSLNLQKFHPGLEI